MLRLSQLPWHGGIAKHRTQETWHPLSTVVLADVNTKTESGNIWKIEMSIFLIRFWFELLSAHQFFGAPRDLPPLGIKLLILHSFNPIIDNGARSGSLAVHN